MAIVRRLEAARQGANLGSSWTFTSRAAIQPPVHRPLPRAIGLTSEALALCEQLGDRHRQAALENNLADLLQGIGRRDEALEHLKRAVAIFADVGDREGSLEPEIWKLVEW